MRIRPGVTRTHAAPRGAENGKLAPLLCSRGASWFRKWGEGRGGSVAWAKGVTEVVCPPPRRCRVQRSRMAPAFAPCSSEGAVGLFDLCVSCPESAPVPLSFSVSVTGGDVCPGANTAARGPTSQPVPKTATTKQRQTPSRGEWLSPRRGHTGIGRVA